MNGGRLAETALQRRLHGQTALILTCCLLAFASSAPRALVGVYQRQLLNAFDVSGDFATNWQAAQTLAWALSAPLAGALADRFGGLRIAACGAFLAAACIGALAISTEPGMLLASAGIALGAGLSALAFPAALQPLAQIQSGRSQAFGLAAGAAGLGLFIFTPLAFAIVGLMGWRASVLCFSLGLTICGTVAARAGKRACGKPTRQRTALALRGYLALLAITALTGFIFAFVSQRFQKYAFDAELAANTGAILLVAFCTANIFGAVGGGLLLERMQPGRVLALTAAARLALMVCLISIPAGTASVFAVATLHGLSWLSIWAPTAALILAWFGSQNVGIRLGVCVCAFQFGGLAGGFAHLYFGASLALWWALTMLSAIAIAVIATFSSEKLTPRPESP